MEPEDSKRTGDKRKCQDAKENLEHAPPETLGRVSSKDSKLAGLQDRIRLLDEIRRVHASNPSKLWRRAVVTDEYIAALSAAGLLSAQGLQETDCRMDVATGELLCNHTGSPDLDCRVPACPYGELMRLRLVWRLRGAYARERKKHVGQ